MTSPNTPVDVEADVALIERLKRHAEKRAPVQGLTGGIPWSMHLRAYDAYCNRWGKQDALIDLEGRGCRGGFGTEELDGFIPGWREELERPIPPELAGEAASALSRLLAERREMLEALKEVRDWDSLIDAMPYDLAMKVRDAILSASSEGKGE